jgi:hypothetical protein
MPKHAIAIRWTAATILLLTFCTSAIAQDKPRAAPADSIAAAEASAAVKKYLTLLTEEKWEAAADSCYCANDNERAASRAWAHMASEHYACDRLAVKHLGIAQGSFSMTVPPESAGKSKVLLLKDRAMVTLNKDVRYPLLRVNGTWRISIEGLSKVQGRTPEMMTAYYLSQLDKTKKLHADLQWLDQHPVDPRLAAREAQAREAATLIPTAEQLEHPPADTTPAGALRQYLLYCGTKQTHAKAMAMCYAEGELAKGLIESLSLYAATKQDLYRAAVYRFGRAAADQILPEHLVSTLVDQCTFKEAGETAQATFPLGEIMPFIKIDGHWKLSMSEYCRLAGKTERDVFQSSAHSALVISTVAQDLLNSRYDSPDAVTASLKARGFRFLP